MAEYGNKHTKPQQAAIVIGIVLVLLGVWGLINAVLPGWVWNMLGTSATVLLAYPLAAMCFGYTILAFRQHFFFSLLAAPLRIDEESDDEEEGQTVEDRDDKLETLEKQLAEKLPRWRRRLIVLPWLIAILFLTFEAWLSLPQARASIARNIRNYADEVLDNLEGRPLLLADEIFGELMRIRVSEQVAIDAHFDVKPDSATPIAPLIFISLIENAFKHGISPLEPSFIRIVVSETPDSISCVISNSNHPKTATDKSGSGIGLEQVKRRLELIYPGRYRWTCHIADDRKTYESSIIIYL